MSDPDAEERDVAGAAEEQCAVDPVEEADEQWDPFEQLQEGVALDSRKVVAEDGMPSEYAPPTQSDVPPLSPETLVCMPRLERFVLRGDWGEIVAEFDPAVVERAPDGSWRARLADSERAVGQLLRWASGQGLVIYAQAGPALREACLRCHIARTQQPPRLSADWVEVEPIRPACRHYLRQCTQLTYNPAEKANYRLCALRRTTEGAMMSVTDRAMWACDQRDPPEVASERRWLDDFDALKVHQGCHRTYTPLGEGFPLPSRPAVTIATDGAPAAERQT
jgi:hypothetical protein